MAVGRLRSYIIGACALTLAVALAACGSTEGAATNSTTSWRDVNVCGLLQPKEVTGFLRGTQAKAIPKDNRFDRPTCLWGGGMKWGGDHWEYMVKLQLWQPPAPKVLTDNPERVINVAGRKGYVAVEIQGGSCTMNVKAEPAWIQIEADPPPPKNPDTSTRACDRAAKLVQKVLTRLGW